MSIDKALMEMYFLGVEPRNPIPRLPIIDYYASNTSMTFTCTDTMREIFVSNDADTVMTVQILGPANYTVTITLYGGETLEERCFDFTQVIITATGDWRAYTRSGRIY